MCCGKLCGVDHTNPCCTEAGDHVNDNFDLICFDTGKTGRFLVAADCKYIPSKWKLLQDDNGNNCKHCENVNTSRNAGNIASKDLEACVAKSVITFDVGECCSVGTKVCKTTADIHGTKGSDKWCYT